MIDAAGAIYVIGGFGGNDGNNYLNDVLKSADGGADRTRGYDGGCSGVIGDFGGLLPR